MLHTLILHVNFLYSTKNNIKNSKFSQNYTRQRYINSDRTNRKDTTEKTIDGSVFIAVGCPE